MEKTIAMVSDKKAVTGKPVIALVGNPNSGKTSVFNALTGLRQKVSNYPGVTVEKKTGILRSVEAGEIEVYDLPGLYSLIPKSLDDKIASDLIYEARESEQFKLFVVVIDASNLSRNLYLVTQLLDIGIPVIIALNMMDVATKNGLNINIKGLSEEFGTTVVPIIANKRQGIDLLKKAISKELQNGDTVKLKSLEIPAVVKDEIASLKSMIKNGHPQSDAFLNARALRFISSDIALQSWKNIYYKDNGAEIDKQIKQIRKNLVAKKYHWSMLETRLRYEWIDSVVNTHVDSVKKSTRQLSDRVDSILTHKIAGLAIFFGVFALIFQALFTWAEIPMNAIEEGVSYLSQLTVELLPAGVIRSMIVDGVIAGVGAIFVFLPQILFLFFFLSLLEDTGYMARVAFMLDRIMQFMGLSGRSVIPLLSSFACAIPGIMASRTIQNWRDRLVTIMIAPFMSCSARLPVYILLIAAFIPQGYIFGFIAYSTIAILAMYTLGIVGAIAVALVFKKFVVKHLPASSFVMELPPYRRPSIRWTTLQMYERAKVFVTDAGKIILAMSIVLWFLASYPKSEEKSELSSTRQIEQSYAGQIGKFIEPAILPLGFDWKIGVGLLTSFAAREVMVSTMATIYNVEGADESSVNLRDALKNDTNISTGKPTYSPLMAVSLMVFFVFACQCMATVAIVKRETNSWRWPLIMIVYMTALAYFASLLVYQGGLFLGIGI